MMRCDVLDEAFKNETIIGLTHAELRERSHNPQKFFGVQYMQLPDYTMGRDYALLNQLRAAVRETEVGDDEALSGWANQNTPGKISSRNSTACPAPFIS